MSNSFFKFKQFVINQERCAMKVGTDGVLLGAWTNVLGSNNALDIGTGTGLIALMLAQRNLKLSAIAIDIDQEAINQAKENFLNSTFSERIKCEHISIEKFADKSQSKYDLVVSNPPYFKDSLKSPNLQRSLARHTDSLPVDILFKSTNKLLSEDGRFSIIYPYDAKEALLSLSAEHGLYPSRITNVFPNTISNPKRVLMEFYKTPIELIENNLIVEKDRHIYSHDFIELIKDFYLKY